jgi:hypothetical protein
VGLLGVLLLSRRAGRIPTILLLLDGMLPGGVHPMDQTIDFLKFRLG